MATPKLVIGDTFSHPGTFYSGDPSLPYNITGAQITVAVVTPDHAIKLCGDTLQNLTAETNTTGGQITVTIPASITAEIGSYISSVGSGLIELQVDDGTAKYTWFAGVDIIRGQVA